MTDHQIAEKAAINIWDDLSGRKVMEQFEEDIRAEIIAALSAIILSAITASPTERTM